MNALALLLTAALAALYNYASHRTVRLQSKVMQSFAGLLFVWCIVLLHGGNLADIGLENYQAGVVFGLAVGAIIVVSLLIANVSSRASSLFIDSRNSSPTTAGIAKKIGIEIPFATVLFEEVLFRGLLVYLLDQLLSFNQAMIVASLLFGMWHLLPSIHFTRNVSIAPKSMSIAALATVGATTMLGLFLCVARFWSGSLLAPIIIHCAINVSGYLTSARATHSNRSTD